MAKIILFFLLFTPPLLSHEPRTEVQLGVHAKAPPLTPDTLQKLAQIGIRFTFPTPRPNLRSSLTNSRENGVFFLTDFKEEVFRKWLENPEFRPGSISMGEDHLVELK